MDMPGDLGWGREQGITRQEDDRGTACQKVFAEKRCRIPVEIATQAVVDIELRAQQALSPHAASGKAAPAVGLSRTRHGRLARGRKEVSQQGRRVNIPGHYRALDAHR